MDAVQKTLLEPLHRALLSGAYMEIPCKNVSPLKPIDLLSLTRRVLRNDIGGYSPKSGW